VNNKGQETLQADEYDNAVQETLKISTAIPVSSKQKHRHSLLLHSSFIV
jgi:hypothetical protein